MKPRDRWALGLLLVASSLIDSGDGVMARVYRYDLYYRQGGEIFGDLGLALLLVGYALGAWLVHRFGARVAVIAGGAGAIAMACVLGAPLFGIGEYMDERDSLLVSVPAVLSSGVFAIGALLLVAGLIAGDAPTPRRFAALSAFLLARSTVIVFVPLALQLTGIFPLVWIDSPAPIRVYVFGAAIVGAIPLASALILLRKRALPKTAPLAGVYRASAMEPAAETPRSDARLLLPLLAPTILLTSQTQGLEGDNFWELARVPLTGAVASFLLIGALRRRPRRPLFMLGATVVIAAVLDLVRLSMNSFDMSDLSRALGVVGYAIGLSYFALARGPRTPALVAGFMIAIRVATQLVLPLLERASYMVTQSPATWFIVPVVALGVGVRFLWRAGRVQTALEQR